MATPLTGVGSRLHTFAVPSLNGDEATVTITKPTTVASYSWLDRVQPTISVPSSPPVWRNRSPPFTVAKDNFNSFIDQNTHRVPAAPLQSLFASVLHLQPDFNFKDVDIITDRNNLRKLLRWIGGDNPRDFRIDVELVNTTMFFVRKETKTMEWANKGYGHGFEKAVTNPLPGEEKQTGHHRIIRYNFSGVQMLVRFEVDACLPETSAPASEIESVLAGITTLDLGASSNEGPVSTTSHGLTVIPSRNTKLVDTSRTIELKTVSRKFKHSFRWEEVYPQLLLSQTAHNILGVHDFGQFSSFERSTLQQLQQGTVGQAMKDDLKRLRAALLAIQGKVEEQGEGVHLSLVCESGVLELRSRSDGKGAVPIQYASLFKS